MNFSTEENGELTRLKKQLNQKDIQISQLLNDKERSQGQYAQTTKDFQSEKQRLESEVARLLQKEAEAGKLKEEREQQKIAYSNLQQIYNTTKLQLVEKEKGNRLYENDSDRRFQKESFEKEAELESLREKCRKLEAECSLKDTASLRNGDAISITAALQREISALKADKERSHSSNTFCAECSSCSNGSSNLSKPASSEVYQLRAFLAEREKEIQFLQAKLSKAEKEALKAANELIALSKDSKGIIANLESKVSDLTDEVAFQRDHLLKKLEESLIEERGKVTLSDDSLKAAKEEFAQQERVLKASRDTTASLQEANERLCSELATAIHKGQTLQDQLVAAQQVSKLLQRRDGEVESARKRVRKLSSSLRKILSAITTGQVLGDETVNQSIAGQGDETTSGNLTMNGEYEADLLDELEHLLGYVDEADSRVEFAKVERKFTENGAANEKRELEGRIEELTHELLKVQEEIVCQRTEQKLLQGQFDALTDQKAQVEEVLQEKTLEMESLKADKITLQEEIDVLRTDLENAEKMKIKTAEEYQTLVENLSNMVANKRTGDEQFAKLQEELDRIRAEKDRVENQVIDLEDKLKTLEKNLESERIELHNLGNQKHKLQEEKSELDSQLLQQQSNVSVMEQRCQKADLEVTRMGQEVDELHKKLRVEMLRSSQSHVDTLAKGLEVLKMESRQWKDLVGELRNLLCESQSQLVSNRFAQEEELHTYSKRLAALEAELMSAVGELQDGKTRIERYELDLQASLVNQQLAEDALKRFMPSRETDVTVMEDLSVVETSRESAELKELLEQARTTLQDSQEKQRASEVEINDALEEVQHWKTEVSRVRQGVMEIERHSQEKDVTIRDLSVKIQEVEASKSKLQAIHDQLQFAHETDMKRNEALLDEIAAQEARLITIEEERQQQLQQIDAVKEELQEAQEGYNSLKELMENRNAEYWDTKEELAEWQERYERSQADVKIKEDLEERLKESLTEMENTKKLSEEYAKRCNLLEENIALAQREVEQSRIHSQTLEAELEKSRLESIRSGEIEEQLAAANNLIEQLEQDLAQKAQECEDADDKELALRKDNKKLAARIANLQVKVEKLQLHMSASRSAATSTVKVSTIVPSRSVEGGISNATTSSVSKKRRAPEEEDQVKEDDRLQARAIYAPKLMTSTGNPNARIVSTLKATGTTREQPPIVAQRAMASQPRLVSEMKPSHSPSNLLAKKLKSPTKGNNLTLQDRTNLMQPRQLNTLQDGGTGQGNNPFLTKLNRYRPVSNHIVGLGQGADPAS